MRRPPMPRTLMGRILSGSLVSAALESLPGQHLAIVRYSSDHNPLDEWVYNPPDIDGAKVIWAREMRPDEDLELIRYYPNRRVWLVEPDARPRRVGPYPKVPLKLRLNGAPAISNPAPPDGR